MTRSRSTPIRGGPMLLAERLWSQALNIHLPDDPAGKQPVMHDAHSPSRSRSRPTPQRHRHSPLVTAFRQRSATGRAAPSSEQRDAGASRQDEARSWRLARQEFLVAASNPKALILFTVFLPQFLGRDADSMAAPLLLLGTAYIAVEFFCACGYAALGSRLRGMGIAIHCSANHELVRGPGSCWLASRTARSLRALPQARILRAIGLRGRPAARSSAIAATT